MRISVCEFLRLSTQKNWFYVRPGQWASDTKGLRAARPDDEKPDVIKVIQRGKTKTLKYYEGLPHMVVRANFKSRN